MIFYKEVSKNEVILPVKEGGKLLCSPLSPISPMGEFLKESTIKCIQKRRRSNVVEKFRKVSMTVWVSWKRYDLRKHIKRRMNR